METKEIKFKNKKAIRVYPENDDFMTVKEMFSDGSWIVYPFRYDDEKGTISPRYENIISIKIDKKTKVEKGLYQNINYGLGFTSKAREIPTYIQKKFPKVKHIVISNSLKESDVKGETIYFSLTAFNNIIGTLYGTKDFHKKEVEENIGAEFFGYFTDLFDYKEPGYVGDDIFNRYLPYDSFEGLTENDFKTIEKIIKHVPIKVSSKTIVTTRETVDKIYLENIIDKFSGLMEKSVTTKEAIERLEKQWQKFFKQNSWLLAQLFYSPVTLFEDEAYVGGKEVTNKNGKLADFLYKNEFDNVALIEIKTHLTPLMESSPYRGTDVFATSKDVNGGLSQVLNQRDNLLKEFHGLRYKSKEDFEAFNPHCLLLVGKYEELDKDQSKSFELFRNSNKDVTIVTFDELEKKIQSMYGIMTGEIKGN
ncbi:Shedu immune nuclease family protein [Mangrovibacterium diazotrophicum]|uniref:Uncharacterized protein DUF4263 n=1 Tax=Mangrovibacterium diazotrophicum TaxID=1261403 RepID=A0A419VV07_9BACT|nr:Shedu immune nuclease family protein [Mangrovibacterium diazotrophicum]RKD85193.1 uncharacterized protein DUF4263 [Mangrovibacterium diazotrophicum]